MASNDPRIIRVGTADLPAGLLTALGIVVLGGLIAQGSRTGQDRGRTASPTPPAVVRQDTPESTQQPDKTNQNQGADGEPTPANSGTHIPHGGQGTQGTAGASWAQKAGTAESTQSATGGAIVSPDRRQHILNGDATGGGHRSGTGIPGKTEFPANWSDDKVIEAVEGVANDPASTRTLQPNGRIRVGGRREGIDIRVIIDPDGKIIRTAHPINKPRNP